MGKGFNLFRSPKYEDLRNFLRKDILKGKYKSNQLFPSQNELSRKYKVSNSTVREAIGALVQEGFLYRIQGKGTFTSKLPGKSDQQSKVFGFVLCHRDLQDPFYLKVLKGAEREASKNGYLLFYLNCGPELSVKELEQKLSLLLNIKNLEGIILTGEISRIVVNYLENKKVPFVLVGDIAQKQITENKLEVIASDDYQGSCMAVKYLIDLAHKEIGLITGNLDQYVWGIRKKGYEDTLIDADIPIRQEYIIECSADKENEGYKAMEHILESNINLTAVFAGNDRYARGCYHALRDRGLKVPDDFSIIGFDNLDFSKELNPPLTTIDLKIEYSGELAILRLIYLKNHPDTKLKRHVIKSELVERSSCRSLNEKDYLHRIS